MYLKLAQWWASLLDKKIYVAITFISTVLWFGSMLWHGYDAYQWDNKESGYKEEVSDCRRDITRLQTGNELINTERINELKADRDTAFARLDRLTRLIQQK